MAYASKTEVSTSQSEQEIKRTLKNYGATDTVFAENDSRAVVMFIIANRQVKIVMPLPDRNEKRFTHHSRGERTKEAANKEWEQACRSLWRALANVVKFKLEAVEVGISTVEREFLADVVMANGLTVGEWMRPQVAQMYNDGRMPPLMLTGS
jgi:hypothetical protein